MIVSERPREGWSVVNEQGETVALDLELTPELVRAGLAREVVRLVQEARKASGFEVTDRIALRWRARTRVHAAALIEHPEQVKAEVLASTIAEAESPDGLAQSDTELGLAFTAPHRSESPRTTKQGCRAGARHPCCCAVGPEAR